MIRRNNHLRLYNLIRFKMLMYILKIRVVWMDMLKEIPVLNNQFMLI